MSFFEKNYSTNTKLYLKFLKNGFLYNIVENNENKTYLKPLSFHRWKLIHFYLQLLVTYFPGA